MSTDTTEKRQKVVMALGIATIILFSANLLTVLAQHFWPESGFPFQQKQEVVVAQVPAGEYQIHVHSDDNVRHEHRVIVRAPRAVSTIHFEQIERELAEVEAAADRLEREMTLELRQLEAKELAALSARTIEMAQKVVIRAAEVQDTN